MGAASFSPEAAPLSSCRRHRKADGPPIDAPAFHSPATITDSRADVHAAKP